MTVAQIKAVRRRLKARRKVKPRKPLREAFGAKPDKKGKRK